MNPSPLTREELQALREALGEAEVSGQHAALRTEYERDFAAIAGLLAVDHEEPMPAHVLARLKRSGDADWEARHGRSKALGFTVITGMAASPMPAAVRPPPRKARSWLAMAAMLAVLGLIASLLFRSPDPTRPTFAWNNAPEAEQKYDVWVLPAEGEVETVKALFTAKGVRSPVRLASMTPTASGATRLDKDKPHRLLICLASAGRFAGEPVPFTPMAEVPGPTPTAPDMLRKLIAAGRLKDAQTLLKALPESVRDGPALLELAKQVPP